VRTDKVAPVDRPGNPKHRLVALVILMVIAALLLAGRVVYVQGVDAHRFAAFGESQRVRRVPLPAARGAIFDRNGVELAMSVPQRTVWVNPKLVTDPLAEAGRLAPVLGLDVAQVRDQLTKSSSFAYVARKVSDAVGKKVDGLHLDGVFTIAEPKRFLPAGDLAAPVLGKVGLDNNGLSGLEARYEKALAGEPGLLVVERDPSGREIPGGVRQHIPSARGEDLVLTLDRSLQYETERALSAEIVQAKAKGGMAIVMDSTSGEVLSMASLVAGDNGAPPQAASNNRTLTAVFEPGSVNKLITIAGALQEGVIAPSDRLAVPGTIRVGSHTFSEHDPHPTQSWSITDIVANSSNVGSIMIGQKLGKDRLDGYLRAFGLGSRTAINFPGESAGLLLDPAHWYSTSMGTTAIGQGLAVTAMQMLAAYNTIANGGEYVAPKLVRATVDRDGHQHPTPASVRHRVVSEQTARDMTAMLEEVVRVGTAKLAAIDGYTVAGKTGTARKPDEHVRGYKAGAYVSSFAGFVPAEKPALTAMVVLDEPQPIFGGLVAAPRFAQIAEYALRELRIPPPAAVANSAAPDSSPEAARPVGEADVPVTVKANPTTSVPATAPSRSP
jgi:cell division protein FtsI (penicillin-binding protein 3)